MHIFPFSHSDTLMKIFDTETGHRVTHLNEKRKCKTSEVWVIIYSYCTWKMHTIYQNVGQQKNDHNIYVHSHANQKHYHGPGTIFREKCYGIKKIVYALGHTHRTAFQYIHHGHERYTLVLVRHANYLI